MNTNTNGGRISPEMRTTLLISAGIIVIIALVWRVILSSNSLSSSIADELNAHGCSVAEGDFYEQDYSKNTTIRQMMGEQDMSKAVEVSKAVGFGSNIDLEGEIYLLLADLGDDEHVLTVFVVNEHVELAFIQTLSSDEVFPINSKP